MAGTVTNSEFEKWRERQARLELHPGGGGAGWNLLGFSPMCRIAAYLGPSISVDRLLREPPHSLLVQAKTPREMPPGSVNGDGYGFAFYPGGAPLPGVYRTTQPIWADENLGPLTASLYGGCILAALRLRTGPASLSVSDTAPFRHQQLAFTHNGELEDFVPSWMRALRKDLPDSLYQRIGGTSDSEHLFVHLCAHLGKHDPGDSAAVVEALHASLVEIDARARKLGKKALLTIVLTNGKSLIAARHAVGKDPPSLYYLQGAKEYKEAVLVASEPLFPHDNWQTITPGTIWLCTADGKVKTVKVEH